jgi:hypothetical protein
VQVFELEQSLLSCGVPISPSATYAADEEITAVEQQYTDTQQAMLSQLADMSTSIKSKQVRPFGYYHTSLVLLIIGYHCIGLLLLFVDYCMSFERFLLICCELQLTPRPCVPVSGAVCCYLSVLFGVDLLYQRLLLHFATRFALLFH